MNKLLSQFFKDLENQKKNGVSQSFLIYGPKGIDKVSVAKKMASVFIGKPIEELKKNPDFYYLSSNKTIKIGDIRRLIKKFTLTSYGGYKVAIINNAHFLTPEASNSILKLIEEPDKKTVFVLVSNNIEKILPTIRSRCLELYCGIEKKEEIYKSALKKELNKSLSEELSKISIGRNGILNKIKTKKDLSELKNKQKEIFNNIFLNDLDDSFLWASSISKSKRKTIEILESTQIFIKDLLIFEDMLGLEFEFLKSDYEEILKSLGRNKLLEIAKKVLDYYQFLEYNISEKLLLENLILFTRNYE